MSGQGRSVHSVEKAIRLLDCFWESGGSLALTELVQKTGWAKSTVHGRCFCTVYSVLRASTGSFLAAILDGTRPAMRVSATLITISAIAPITGSSACATTCLSWVALLPPAGMWLALSGPDWRSLPRQQGRVPTLQDSAEMS